MTRAKSRLFIIALFALYASSFCYQERLYSGSEERLPILPSALFLKATTGYMHQAVAEAAFVQSAVFLGGVKPGVPPETYAQSLAHNYLQVTSLYPEFQDPYYYAQSYLADVGSKYSLAVNDILDNGRKAYPENTIFPFFQAYNCFRHLDEPLKAAEIFREASTYPNAPPMFAHLAATLSAKGGMLEAAIIALTALKKSSDDKNVIKRYQEEIDAFHAAITVQGAVNSFHTENQRYPEKLDELVPRYIDALPTLGPFFELTWSPPIIGVSAPGPNSEKKNRRNLPVSKPDI